MTKSFAVKTKSKSQEIEMRFYKAPHDYDAAMLSGVIIYVFDAQDRVLTMKDKKSFRILSGLVEWDDDTIEDTVRREALEQARIILGPVTVAAVVETTLEDQIGKKPVVTLVVTGRAKAIEPYPAQQKDRRVFLAKPDFLTRCADGNIESQPKLLEMVEAALAKAGKSHSGVLQ